jgi:uncharacterized membrane protein YcaP (DUF421 family)
LLLGRAPFGFALEVLGRTLVMYLLLLVAVRFLGKRMSGQVTILELAVMLALGAIVSGAMQVPERGLVLGAALLAWIVFLQFGFSRLTSRVPRAEDTLVGRVTMLVQDGVVQPRELERARVSQQQLFAVLRSQHVLHLGEVERVYLEACGAFSILRRDRPARGLSVLPPSASRALSNMRSSAEQVCAYCGTRAPDSGSTPCSNCDHRGWVAAVESGAGGAAS